MVSDPLGAWMGMPGATTEVVQEQGAIDGDGHPGRPELVTPERRSPIEPELVEAAREGHNGALEQLIREAYPLVRRWTAVHGAEPWDVDDVTQEVMILVLRRLDSFRGEARFTTWLYRIARNVWLDRRKSQTRGERKADASARAEERDPLGSIARPADDPASLLEKSEVLHRVATAFEGLPPRQREVFDLADLQGFSSAEIAEMLELEPSTVRVTLLNARRTLRKRLMEMDPDLAEEHGP
jgi:RNA polymerase sigma-70 factor (ECF subfamily)